MEEFNPYAPPKADLSFGPDPESNGVWRDAALLVMTKKASLPDRCLKCNEPADGWTLKRKLMWHPQYWYLLIFFNLIIYAIVAMIVRHTAVVMVPLCADHRRRRRRAIAVGWLLSIAGIVAFILGVAIGEQYSGLIALGASILFLVGLIYGLVGAQTAVPHKIDKRFVWLKKVHPAFLAGLPSWEY
jgi:MFS family permease